MSSYATLQSRVLGRLIDTPAFVQGEVPTLINDAIRLLQQIHNFKCMEAEVQFVTNSAATNAHVLSQINTTAWTWKAERDKPYFVFQIGSTRELVWYPNRSMTYREWDPFSAASKGPPRGLLLGEPANTTVSDPANPDKLSTQLNIEVYPLPDGASDWTTTPAGEYRINVPYWGFLPDLSAGSDTNWFTENATQFIICMATAMGFDLDWDEPRANLWYSRAIGPKGDLADHKTLGGWARAAMTLDRARAIAPLKTLVPRTDVFGPRDSWRT